MKIILLFVLSVMIVFCSCATHHPIRPSLPAVVTLNKNAGRGNWIIVKLKLAGKRDLPFVVDTGAPFTDLSKSLEPKLGKRLGTGTIWNFGVKHSADGYLTPKLYLGTTALLTGTNFVIASDFTELSTESGQRIMGILGMDVLKNYCIQLDFKARTIRFLDDRSAERGNWGKAFRLTDIGDGSMAVDENLAGVRHSASLGGYRLQL
ncbi:MAG: hypothetical protein ACREFE_07500 [Limisphaerales bacterium]